MPKFSKRSKAEMITCHPRLQRIFKEVIKHYDCTILKGHRGEDEQNEAFRTGHSKLVFPKSKHNKKPSEAIDAAPYPINWNDRERFYSFAGFVMGVASQMQIKIRWGGDWDSDWDFEDQTFNDLTHFELVD